MKTLSKKLFLIALTIYSVHATAQWGPLAPGGTSPTYLQSDAGINLPVSTLPGAKLEIRTNNASDMASIFRYGPTSQNLFLVPYTLGSGFNPMTPLGDVGIFWNDQADVITNSNLKAGLTIAPKHSVYGGLRIDQYGRTGFGHNAPKGKVHVVQTNPYTINQQSVFNDALIAELNSQNVPNNNVAAIKSVVFNAADNAFMMHNPNFGKAFIIKGNGATQIGLAVPTGSYANAMLSVDGKIVAKEIYVEMSNWADFVFKKDYKLMPLEELSEYIKTNRHLPGVAPESEVLQNGISLNEVSEIHMQKIEELTLYLISINEKLRQLETENILLKQQVVAGQK